MTSSLGYILNSFWQNHPKTYPFILLIVGLYVLKFFTLLVYKKRNSIKNKDNFIIGINTIYYIFLSILSILLVLVLMKVNIKEFFTSISIIAAAIAILSKDYISNAINGMILMFNNQISIDDHIKIGEHKGRITHISLLNVQLLNEENDLIYIPNTTVLGHEIINYSKGYNKYTFVEAEIDKSDFKSIEDLQNFLRNELEKEENVKPETLKLKVSKIQRRKLVLKTEVELKDDSAAQEILFKRHFLNAWVKYLSV